MAPPPGRRPAGHGPVRELVLRESYRFFHGRAADKLKGIGVEIEEKFAPPDMAGDAWPAVVAYRVLAERDVALGGRPADGVVPDVELKETAQAGAGLDLPAAIATALVMFALFFTCVYLMPSLTCEERERGLLLAQALSPATSLDILAAKFLFYPAFGVGLAAILGGLHNPKVLAEPYFWLALLALSVGTIGIGMVIACLARTQRAASLGALCYMLAVALVLLVCQQTDQTVLPQFVLEFHAPHVLHAVLTGQVRPDHVRNLLTCGLLAVAWALAAAWLFQRRGWQ